MKTFLKITLVFIAGVIFGGVEENLRYSIIANEANKGDSEAKQIMNELVEVGSHVEDKLS